MSEPRVTITEEEPLLGSPADRFKVNWESANQGWSLPRLNLDGLRQLDAEVSRILRPTAEQVYESTLDNLFNGESDGRTEAPTGWFAIVGWPNGHTYLVSHDDLGFSHFLGSTDHRAPVCLSKERLEGEYARLAVEYAAWDSE